MSTLSRRLLFKGIAAAGATGAAAALESPAESSVRRQAPPDALGMLYDATLCIGCKACVVACRDANGLEPDREGIEKPLYEAPTDLNDRTKNIIKLYKEGETFSYVKVQCMHCVDPACTNACMLGALKKKEHGVVSYQADLCIGCRYCQIACPFSVPKFEWQKAAPRIVKCELCRHRARSEPMVGADGFTRYPPGEGQACTEVCPRKAVISGTRDELLAEAKRRLAEHPERYVGRIYGETDAGGTQVLYLSHVPFEKLGFPDVGDEAVPDLQRTIQHGVYKGFVAPVALYATLGLVALRNRRKPPASPPGESAPGGGGA